MSELADAMPSWAEGAGNRSDMARCRAILYRGSRTFWAASLLLPRSVREPATALYAFCRCADDAIDLEGGGTDAVRDLRARLALAYGGRPRPSPVDRAFAEVAGRFAIPRAVPEALIDGFAWDDAGQRYGTLPELRAYAARVAGTVGAMMALLMGVRDPEALARACDLGVAMQLSNIARDVGEDAANGRIYLPLSWLREAGIDPDAWLADPRPSPALAGVVARLLAEADALYARAEAGIAALPAACRPGIFAARLLYAEIGREVERLGPDALRRRAVVPTGRKLRLLARAVAAAMVPNSPHGGLDPALPETMFLLEAVAHHPAAAPAAAGRPVWWDLRGQALWVIGLFDQLARRDQAGPGPVLRAGDD